MNNGSGDRKFWSCAVAKNRLIQFSLATLLAVTTVFTIGTAVLRPGFESWQVAAANMATVVFFGAIFGAAFQKARHWGYWVVFVVVSVPVWLLSINTVGSYGQLFLLAVFGFGVAVLTRHLRFRYLSPTGVS